MDFGFHRVYLLKDQQLGTGSYGAVYKAKCDELLCAAKVVHPTLYGPGANNIPVEKFQQECRLLCAVKHPNIVQYLGTYREPDTKHLVLLMELCDCSLTSYLENSPRTIPHHIQVNICHDISLALVYLHNNNLIHRDLSSNNVLLMKDLRAKITDFGMSRFMHSQLTPLTLCPGTQAYMPPEALNDNPQYSPKLDCFSLGVLAIQIVTRKFPEPRARFETISSPNTPLGVLLQPVPEEKRRSSHISLIQASHPFLPLIRKCLSYKEQQRPTAIELCRSMADLKTATIYNESMQPTVQTSAKVDSTEPQASDSTKKANVIPNASAITDLERLRQEVRDFETQRQISEEKARREIKQRDDEIQGLKEKLVAMHEKLVSYQPEQDTGRNNEEDAAATANTAEQQFSPLNLTWELANGETPHEFYRGGAVVLGESVYCHSSAKKVVSRFDVRSNIWSNLPQCKYSHYSLAVVNGVLTAIGGYDFTTTNQLFSFLSETKGKGDWVQQYRSMPTARCNAASVCTDQVLVVAGGDASGYNDYLGTVEVMDIDTGKWTEVSKLPFPHINLSAAIANNGCLYLAGGLTVKGKNAVYSCSLNELVRQPPRGGRFRALSLIKRPNSIWRELSSPPVTQTTLVIFKDHLIAIGGQNTDRKPAADVYKYDEDNECWNNFSNLNIPRNRCIAGVFGGMIVCIGGQGERTIEWACD